MSANNWAICPRCLSEKKAEVDAATAEVYAQYGNVPPEEFDRLRSELPEVDKEKLRTLREDYEFYGAEDGELRVSYSGGCAECGLSVNFKASKRFWPEEEAA